MTYLEVAQYIGPEVKIDKDNGKFIVTSHSKEVQNL